MRPVIDLTAKRIGRWLVQSRAPIEKRGTYWKCLCDCGQSRVAFGPDLKRGVSRSCGCLAAELNRAAKVHGEGRDGKKTPEYNSWRCMNSRCNNPNDVSFARYGGRDIKVCKRWRDSYSAFLADLGRKPSPEHTLDRIKNHKGYVPGNVRWATPLEQAQNTRQKEQAVRLTYLDQTLLLTEWAAKFGIDQSTVRRRLAMGWAIERTLTTPTRIQLTLHGQTLQLTEWAHKIGLDTSALRYRLRHGWSVERALTTPSGGKTRKARS